MNVKIPLLVFGVYLLVMNIWAFGAMAVDKRRAQKGKWRIRERTLFLLAILGGSLGAVLGMFLCHHKTRHWYFRIGLPAILVLHLALAAWLMLGGPAQIASKIC